MSGPGACCPTWSRWLAQQEASGRRFTATQRWWLDHIAEHIGVNLSMTADDFEYGAFFNKGGSIAVAQVFGADWPAVLDEMNTVLVA